MLQYCEKKKTRNIVLEIVVHVFSIDLKLVLGERKTTVPCYLELNVVFYSLLCKLVPISLVTLTFALLTKKKNFKAEFLLLLLQIIF